MQKTATTAHPLHPLIAERWSPRAFNTRPVEPDKLGSLFEAARWAASCFNAQPWSFMVATTTGDREDFDRMAACLMPANATWAASAPVLALSVARLTFEHNDKPNRHAQHDVGLAVGNLVIQAQALGLAAHQMAGFDADRARSDLEIPDGFEPMAMIAIGYPGSTDDLPTELAEREATPRERKGLGSMVFGAAWGSAHPSFA